MPGGIRVQTRHGHLRSWPAMPTIGQADIVVS